MDINNIENSLRKFFVDNGIQVALSQPENQEFISVVSLESYEKDVKSFDGDYLVDKIHYVLHIVANSHDEMINILKKYLPLKETGEKPFQVYDFSSGKAVSDIECTISMPDPIQFNMPFGTTFMDNIIITYRRLE